MRASSRPRNEAHISAKSLTTTTFGGRSASASANNGTTLSSRRAPATASPRRRATTPSASPAPLQQQQRNPLLSSFHSRSQQQQQQQVASHAPASSQAAAHGVSGRRPHQAYQQNFSLSPEGVVDFSPTADRLDADAYATYGSDGEGEEASYLRRGSAADAAASIAAVNARYDPLINPPASQQRGLGVSYAHDASGVTATSLGAASPIPPLTSGATKSIRYDDDDEEEGDTKTFGAAKYRLGTAATKAAGGNSPQAAAAAGPAQTLLSVEQLKALLDENDKLRFIEREFWALLEEREDAQRELKKLRQEAQRPAGAADAGAREGVAFGGSTVDDILKRHSAGGNSGAPTTNSNSADLVKANNALAASQKENEALRIALHECMDVMMSEELQGSATNTVRRDGPVSAFLAWLQMRHERGEAAAAMEAARHDLGAGIAGLHGLGLGGGRDDEMGGAKTGSSPAAATSIQPGAGDRPALRAITAELQQAHAQVRALQQELDRTDLSRRQALDDCEHMRRQVEALSGQLRDTMEQYRAAQRALLAAQHGATSGPAPSTNEMGGASPAPHASSAAAGGFSPPPSVPQPTANAHRNQQQHPNNIPSSAPAPSAPLAAVGTTAAALTAQLAHRNAEIHRARAEMARLQRQREAEAEALAVDTRRIQRDLTARRSQSAPRADREASAQRYNGYGNNNPSTAQSLMTDADATTTTVIMADEI